MLYLEVGGKFVILPGGGGRELFCVLEGSASHLTVFIFFRARNIVVLQQMGDRVTGVYEV